LLIGEGHFGGDGRQPQITLRMHVKHAPLFDWIERTFPGGRLYGPYNHDGRHYLQWMARGSYLRDVLVPLLDERLSPRLDAKSADRYEQMRARYQQRLGLSGTVTGTGAEPSVENEVSQDVRAAHQPGTINDRSKAADIFDRIRREQAG
jgi:hypothetical protein